MSCKIKLLSHFPFFIIDYCFDNFPSLSLAQVEILSDFLSETDVLKTDFGCRMGCGCRQMADCFLSPLLCHRFFQMCRYGAAVFLSVSGAASFNLQVFFKRPGGSIRDADASGGQKNGSVLLPSGVLRGV